MGRNQKFKPLRLQNVTKKYGDFCAVDDISFSLEEGEIFGLLGPNGAGKTTLISCIVTLEKMNRGEISILGKDVYQNFKEAKSLVGYVPQEVVNHGYFTVKEILQFYSGYFGILQNNDRIDYLLDKLALSSHKNKKVKQLSGGMKRRLMIAKSLVHRPKVLLLDEPTAGVDIELRNSLWEFVLDLRSEGTTVLLTTHYLEEAESLCDRIAVINEGKLLKLGQTKELISEMTFRRLEMETEGELNIEDKTYLISQEPDRLVLEFPSSKKVGEVVASMGIDFSKVKDFQLKEGSLEEAFLKILGTTNV